MKKFLFPALTLLTMPPLAAVNVDIYKEPGDPRVTAFTVPARRGEAVVKKFVMERDGRKFSPQTLLIAKYPDGSPRWYRLIADVPAGRYAVTPGTPQKGALKNQVKPAGKEKYRAFTNKLLTATWEGKPFLIQLESGGKKWRIPAPEITLPDGTRPEPVLRSAAPFDVGPLQTGMEFSGEYLPSPAGEKRYWRLRLTLWGDKNFVGIEPLLGVSLDRPGETCYDEMRAWRAASLRINTDGRQAAVRSAVQWEDSSYETAEDGKIETSKGALGLFDVPGGGKLAIPEMAERFPMGVTTFPDGLRAELLPEIRPRTRYAGRKPEYIQYFALRTGDYVMRAGVELSFPMYLTFDDKTDAKKLLEPVPVGMVDPDDLDRSGAWLNEIRPPDVYSRFYDPEIVKGLDAYLKAKVRERWYGFMNYGDSFGERKWNWFNNEYDAAAVFFEQALRLRKPEYFREALLAARHQTEIDTVKKQPGSRNGAVYTHSLGHTGGYYRDGEFKFLNYGHGGKLFFIGVSSNGHTRIRGMCMAFVLTGDRRFRDTALATGQWIMKSDLFTRRTWGATHREPGWALVNLTSIYWMSGTARFLDAAEALAWIVMSHARGRGVRFDALQKHNCPVPPGGWNEKNRVYRTGALSFPTGYQGTGMYLVYQATQDPYLKKALKENLKATADYIKTRLYFTDRRGFVHSPVPWRRQSTRNGAGAGSALRNVLLIDALLNGDARSLEISRDTMIQMLTRREIFSSPLKDTDPDAPGPKEATSGLYFVPLTLELMRALKLEMPEIKYDLSQRTAWGGAVPAMTPAEKAQESGK
ncbi:MAG: hypothetical protein IJS01_01190 [Lentisphaeria bacterium]|nr:hypothetical protein [Lentisphaeria bacterium]